MKRITNLFLCLPLLVCSSAYAQFSNGNKLLSEIKSESPIQRMFATGYITGVADSYDEVMFCIPTSANVGQMRDIVKDYLVQNSNIRHLHSAALITAALGNAFPCGKRDGL